MNFNPFCNLSEFDIFAKRLGLFHNGKEKLGSYFGLTLTIIYIIISLSIFIYYSIITIKRVDLQVHDSTEYSNDVPYINLNNTNLLYFAFGVENAVNASRFVDETIYRARVVFYYGEKNSGGAFETIEYRDLKIEKCKVQKFGKEYQHLFTNGEFDDSYCVDNFDLALIGGFIYNKFSCIRILIYPCINTTSNNNHCKPQEEIDAVLAGGYFSVLLKDVGLNPNNYSNPILPTIQDFYTTISKDFFKDVIFNYEITEIQTDSGIFYEQVNHKRFIKFDKIKESFYTRSDKDYYYKGKNICKVEVRLSDNIHVQRRSYKKMSSVFSTTGGYMQVIYTIFVVLALIPNQFNFKSIIVNSLLNIDFKKIDKNKNNYINMQSNIIFDKFNKVQSKNFANTKHNFQNIKLPQNGFILKSSKKVSDLNLVKKIKSFEPNNFKQMNNKSINEPFNNVSKAGMMPHNSEFSIEKMSGIKSLSNKNLYHFPKENSFFNKTKRKGIKQIKFNIFQYYCFGHCFNQNKKIELFNKGALLYREQLDIIHIFTHLLDIEKTVTEKNNLTEEIKILAKQTIL